jgi:hypothetical protein
MDEREWEIDHLELTKRATAACLWVLAIALWLWRLG